MKAQIGAYTISHRDGFGSEDEAVEFVRNLYPELGEKLVRLNVKSLIRKNADKSNNAETAVTESEPKRANVREGSSGGKRTGKD